MMKLFVNLSFIPWCLYFIALSSKSLKKINNYDINFKYIRNNFFKIIRFDNLLLVGIFTYFSLFYLESDQIRLVRILLFSVINLYLFINSFYEGKKIEDKLGKEDVTVIMIILFLMLIPMIFYLSTRRYLISYYIMFVYNFLAFFIVLFSSKINDIILSLVGRNESK